jgi:hypothetical protein
MFSCDVASLDSLTGMLPATLSVSAVLEPKAAHVNTGILFLFRQEVKALALVTTRTCGHLDQIVAVKSTLAVVAHYAAIRSGFGRMFLRFDIGYLPALLPLTDVVT